MGLFDNLGGLIEGALKGQQGGQAGAPQGGFASIAEQVFNNAGGLDGVLAKLNESGFGQHVASWIGTGSNLPITADEIRNVLGNEQVQQIAARMGLPVAQVAELLAQHLPTAVDQATPNGTPAT